ncbi:MAG: Ppx/GppA family phosphatase [Ignavibacteria bacterium]|nr:Ppx/GppA family phosphatase [Ignavibacteria bacterium]
MKIASIDIGTNTVLMLLAELTAEGHIRVLGDYHSIPRLGEKISQNNKISTSAIRRTEEVLKDYLEIIQTNNVDKVLCVGTASFRDANNSLEVQERFEKLLGTNIQIISGEEEAYLSFIGTVETEDYSVVLDIGGGSTEIVAGTNKKILYQKSIRMGVVWLTERFFRNHPPTNEMIELGKREIVDAFIPIMNECIIQNVYAVAGTPTTIAMVVQGLKYYDSSKVHRYFLKFDEIVWAREQFQANTVENIVAKFNIPQFRADVIFAGTLILEIFCKLFKLDGVTVSDRGLRYGVLKKFLSQQSG